MNVLAACRRVISLCCCCVCVCVSSQMHHYSRGHCRAKQGTPFNRKTATAQEPHLHPPQTGRPHLCLLPRLTSDSVLEYKQEKEQDSGKRTMVSNWDSSDWNSEIWKLFENLLSTTAGGRKYGFSSIFLFFIFFLKQLLKSGAY